MNKANKLLFHLKFRALLALREYTDSKIQLKRNEKKLLKFHQGIVLKNHFSKWQELFKYYSTMMKESFVKETLAKVIFLRKFLKGWQYSTQSNRYKREALQLFSRNYNERLLSDCFYQLN